MAEFEIRMEGANQLNAYLGIVAKEIKLRIPSALNKIGEYLQDKVKEKFGVYQEGWPKLKRATVIAKYRRRTSLSGISTKGKNKGSFGLGPDEPLILFGRLKDSIHKELGNMEVSIYSDNPYSAVHEYGYKNIPARSYMRKTLSDEEDKIKDFIDEMINKIL